MTNVVSPKMHYSLGRSKPMDVRFLEAWKKKVKILFSEDVHEYLHKDNVWIVESPLGTEVSDATPNAVDERIATITLKSPLKEGEWVKFTLKNGANEIKCTAATHVRAIEKD